MRFLKTLALCLTIIGSSPFLSAQEYIMDGTPINSCSGLFFDPGGSGDYLPETDLSVVICSDESNTHVLLRFQEIALAEGDELIFRDGDSETAPLIELSVSIHSGLPFAVQATATNSSGCLYVTFNSDEENEAAGWQANISCLPACQAISAEIITDPGSLSSEMPVDICQGDTVFFSAQIEFPQNGVNYVQSLETSSFSWRIGSEIYNDLSEVDQVFTEAGIYEARFNLTDVQGCPLINPPSQIIRVSPGIQVIGQGLEEDEYCWGEDITIYTSLDTVVNSPGYIIPFADSLENNGNGSLPDTIFLPDGSGLSYESTLTLSQFPVGSTISEDNPFSNLWMYLEHSYAGDLEIELICPSGQRAYIIDYPAGLGATNFGEPFASGPVDQASSDPTPGIPYLYSFTDNAANGTLIDFDTIAPEYAYTTQQSNTNGTTYSYLDTYYPAGAYRPYESFTAFEGCPFNGDWTLRITDNLGLDNGYVFGWGIGSTSAVAENIIVSPLDWFWSANDNILTQDIDGAVIDPQSTGAIDLQFNVLDNFGCISTTSHTIQVLPINHPDCIEDNTDPTAPVGRDNMLPMMPFTDQLSFTTTEECLDCQLRVFNLNGQQMGTYQFQQGFEIDASYWPAGFYFYQLFNKNNELLTSGQVIKAR